GATRDVPKGTTAAEIAKQISPRLAKEALVARTNGDLIDLSRPLEHDTKLAILTAKDPDAVQVFRHSAAHLLAAAVLELYPNVKLGIGPPIDHGFFLQLFRARPATAQVFLLRVRPRRALYSRRSRKNRSQNARAGRQRLPQRAQDDSQARGARALPQKQSGIQM